MSQAPPFWSRKNNLRIFFTTSHNLSHLVTMNRSTTNVAVEKELLAKVKKHCEDNGLNRKAFIRRALSNAIDKEKPKNKKENNK